MVILVIDTQNLLVNNKLYAYELFEKNVKKVLESARENKVEIIYVRHDDGEETLLTKGKIGFEIFEDFKPLTSEKIIDKHYNSAFKETDLLEYLYDKGSEELIIIGLQTEYCIDATVKCAFDYGFKVIIPHHTNSTIDNEFMTGKESYDYYNKFMWPDRYATCISVEALVNKLNET